MLEEVEIVAVQWGTHSKLRGSSSIEKRSGDTCRSFAYEELRWIVLWEGNYERGHRGLMV